MAPTTDEELIKNLDSFYEHIVEESERAIQEFPLMHAVLNRDNLLAYLSLKEKMPLYITKELVVQGFFPLNHSYSHVIYTFKQILKHLGHPTREPKNLTCPTPYEAKKILNIRAGHLLGKRWKQLQSTIMVTLDAKMSDEETLMEQLLMNGMTIARINCAHNHQQVWLRIIETLRKSETKLRMEGKYQNQKCKIFMDLGGPKVRVGQLGKEGIFVKKGDLLRLFLDSDLIGHPASEHGPAGIPVTLEKAFRNVRLNDRVFIDDGKINGVVREISSKFIEIEILSPFQPVRVKPGKGLNLPDSLLNLNLPALMEKDYQDLEFVAKHADIVGISFVHSPLDLKKLREALDRYGKRDLGVVAKIETKDAVHQVARIILEGLHFQSFGIMIARGDLAVEVGPENLADVQEEILRVCSAAYVPVIWATGVLEKLTKKGIPARSEITDAAQARRADCVMLNKGPHILDALVMLTKLLKGNEHDSSKTSKIEELTRQFGIL
ncbi:pyruvate kinase [Neobacillus niacini]|uniref:pyruvate kinase n=1 Tax=Neobacillus niacini TaxID=86668 RepID=UPI0021CAEF9E|nr:pyruvate kinase [Neobacillus niacini]MCM3764571.1 pyruvate kinase [Neobacillus niacini]